MPSRCVIGGCSNTHRDGVSLHIFPKDQARKKLWVKFVKLTRSDFSFQTHKRPLICSDHFSPESYVERLKYCDEGSQRVLSEVAVPSIKRGSDLEKKKERYVVQKREGLVIASGFSHDEASSSQQTPIYQNYDPEDTVCNKTVERYKNMTVTQQSKQTQTLQRRGNYSKACQSSIQSRSVGLQCDLIAAPPLQLFKSQEQNMVVDSDSISEMDDDSSTDSSSDLISVSDESCSAEGESYETVKEKYIVSRHKLLQLFASCEKCSGICAVDVERVVGTMVVIQAICCQCGYNRFLFSTYQRHQDKYLQPVIIASWVEQRAALLAERRGMPLTIGGDGRADSPGHSAKFGCYTIMDLKTNEIIDMKLIQKNEVTSSNHMELEGLKRGIDALLEEGIRIGELITDRHPSVTKWVRENLEPSGTKHFFDIWHIAKGLGKKIDSKAKLTDCGILQEWRRSIINHLYWSAGSSGGDGDMVEQKVMSLLRHIRNVHTGHGNLYMECQHAPLGDEEKRKKWIFPGQRAYDELESLFDNFRFKKDIRKLSPLDQTSGLEGFHSLLNHFAPKMLSSGTKEFSAGEFHKYNGGYVYSRMLLAVLHHNANSGRPQAKTKDGCLQYEILYPRGKMGQHTVRRVRSEPCYGESVKYKRFDLKNRSISDSLIFFTAYVKVLLQKVISEVDGSSTTSQGDLSLISSPPPTLSSRCERPDKELAIQELQSRFNS
ncbi:uncharacterized protein LOC120336592 [Styela clava]